MIKQLQIEHLAHLIPLFDEYMVFYEKESNPLKHEAYLRERIEKNEATVFVAYDNNDQPVGFVLNYHSFSSTALGRMIGQRMIDRTLELAKELGAVRVDLGTAKTNIQAQGLYEKIGFAQDTEFYSYSYSL